LAPADYKSLEQAISCYKSSVGEALRDLRHPFVLDLLFIVIIPVGLTIVALIFSNVAGFLTTLGVGGVSAGERLRRGQTVLKSYWGDCSRLRKSMERLQLELLLCTPSDTARLQEIESLLRAYMDTLAGTQVQ